MRCRHCVVAFVVGMSLAIASLAAGQTGSTSLRGTVSDSSGAAIARAMVTLTSSDRGIQRTATSSDTGSYEFLQLQPGTYELTVEMTGFSKYQQKQIQLLVDTPATVNVKLAIGTSTEVSAEAAAINTTEASIGNAFSEIQVKQLPMEGRNVPDLLTLQAGVTYFGHRESLNAQSNDTRNGSVNGAHSDQTNITLDGVDVNDQVNGYAFSSTPAP